MSEIVFGYVRISTLKQKLERQIDNIKREYPEAVIISEKGVSGCTLDRPAWSKLISDVERRAGKGEHVTIVFDEVSRMSRNAQEGFNLYERLYNLGVDLRFIKEPHINTDIYRQALEQGISMTGTDVDVILAGINKYLMILAQKQIELAFKTAQHEVDFLHQRTSEGVRKAQASGKQIGRSIGAKVETRKARESKQIIMKHSRDFKGALTDPECMKLTGLSRNTYYKYKKELKEYVEAGGQIGGQCS